MPTKKEKSKSLPPIHAIEEIKRKISSREGKNAIKVVTKSVRTTSKKWTKKQSKRWAKGRKARARGAITKVMDGLASGEPSSSTRKRRAGVYTITTYLMSSKKRSGDINKVKSIQSSSRKKIEVRIWKVP